MLRGSCGRTCGKWLREAVSDAASDVRSSLCNSSVFARGARGGTTATPTGVGTSATTTATTAGAAAAAAAAGAGAAAGKTSVKEWVTIFKQLSKARLSALVVASAAAGFVAGSGEAVDWAKLGWTSFGTFACASAANTLNQVYEVENDRKMKRTCKRPLPLGRITPRGALLFALGAGVVGCGSLYATTNATTSALGAANIFLYAGIYTPLKQVSMWNTWVGALVGAVPPLMGWAAAAGADGDGPALTPGAGVLAAALHFWQLPHFFSLAWICRDDYRKGGYQMLTLMDKTGKRTAACALRNCIYLLPLGFLAQKYNVATEEFTYVSAALTTVMACSALVFYTNPSVETARILFRASLIHLPLYMGSLLWFRRPVGSVEDVAAGEVRGSQSDEKRRPEIVYMPPFPFLPVPGAISERKKEV